jgi:tetratricopeptide (TPR) repeat protein
MQSVPLRGDPSRAPAERAAHRVSAASASRDGLDGASSSATTTPPGRDEFALALYYQRAGEFDQALLHYKAVLQRNELNVEAHNNLGLLYKDKGLQDDAAREFERALYIDPQYLRARNNLGVTRRAQGRLDAAAAEFRAVLAADPRNVDAMVNLALVQKDGGALADARGSLVSALTIDPRNAPAHYNLAVQYEQLGEAGRAVEHYRAFLQYAGPDYASRADDVRQRIDTLSNRIRE